MKSIRLIVAALAMLVICGTGIALGAQGGAESQDASTPASELSEPPQQGPGPELASKRTATSETFRLPDGALETRIYENPINYRDAEGDWRPIGKGLEELEGGGLANGANRFDVQLPTRMGDGSVRLSIGDQWVSYRLLGLQTETAELEDEIASYETANSGLNFELAGLSNGLKENIEIVGPSQPSTFRFELGASTGLSPTVAEDGSIQFRDESEQLVATLPAPVMSDSSTPDPAISDAVEYKLEPQGEDRWLLTVEADREWLLQPDRAWPVRIDPTITVTGEVLDNCVLFNAQSEVSLCATSGWPLLGGKAVYKSSGSDEYARSVMRFNTSAVPKNAYVTSATVSVYSPSVALNTAGGELRDVANKNWASQVSWKNWKNGAPWTSEGGDYGSISAAVQTSVRGSQVGWWNFSSQGLAGLVEGWASGTTPNQGVLFKLIDEKSHECCIQRLLEFYSSAGEAGKRPYLSVTYYPPAPKTSKLTSPSEGTVSARRLKLRSAWSVAGVTGITFQFREGNQGVFQTIPAELVRTAGGQVVSWPIATEGKKETDPLYFDAAHASSTLRSKGGPIQVRALFEGPTGVGGYSAPVNATVNRFLGGPHDASASVGPGTVDLLTGNFSVTHSDVSIPGFKTAFDFSRTLNSRDAGKTGDTYVLGQGWKPSVPVEEVGGSNFKNVRDVTKTEEIEGETYSFSYALLTAMDGQEYAFEKVGETYVTPPEAAGWVLGKEGTTRFVLTETNGNRTIFENASGGSEYLPISVSQAGGSGNATRMVYQIVGGQRRLSMVIAPSAPGVGCSETNATTEVGCHALTFTYVPATTWGAPANYGERLSKITYYAPGNGGPWEVANYTYNAEGRMTQKWDPRISPNLKEAYSYEPGGQLKTITPSGEEPWTMEYGAIDEELANGRLMAVKRPSLLASPAVAQTTIAYGVPTTGSGAPYDLGSSAIAQWGQQDLPVDATAVFPPDQVPSSPPASYSRASVYYMDAEGQVVNMATPSGAGTSAPSITTAETDSFGHINRELSAQNRLRALAAGSESVVRSHELETKRLYSTDGTQMEEEWGPLHQVRLESGEVKQARLHRTVQYNEGWPGTGVNPHLRTRETTGAAVPGQGVDADQRVTEFHYNWTLRARAETIVDPSGLNLHTTTVYNEETGLPIEVRQPAYPSGGDAHATQFFYYTPSGGPSNECKNKPLFAGLLCKVVPAAQPGTPGQPQLLVKKILSYSGLAQPTEVIEGPGTFSENTRKTITTYDAAGRELTKGQEGGGTALPTAQTLYYAETGLPKTQRFLCEAGCSGFDDQATTTTYDKLGRPTKYEDADGNTASTSYDLLDRPVTISDGKGIQTRTYDSTSGLLVKLEDSGAGTFTAAYDADGNLVEEGLPDGLVAKTTYDEMGQPTHLAYEKKTFCSINCTWLDFGAERSIYGQVLNQTSLASTQQYSYDKAGRLTLAKDIPQVAGCTTRSYSYDADSNRTKLTTRVLLVGSICDLTSQGNTQYNSYDAGDRLIVPGITYDNYGRTTSLPSSYAGPGGTLTSVYYTNDLLRSQSQGGITNTYELDGAMRQRTRVQTGGSEPGTEVYHYADGSDSPAWIDRGSSWSRDVAGIGRGLAAIQDSVKGTELQLTNLHGDIVATASTNPEATKLLASFEFDEFGNPKQGSAGKYGWLGGSERRTELPSGLMQMGVRSYVPFIGRFISPDPVSGGSANSYDYVNADPVNGLDLGGTKPWDISSVGPCTGDLHVYSPRANRARNRGGYGKFYVSFRVRCEPDQVSRRPF